MIAAIVCARGGSIRVPRKNAKPFCGLPLMAWSIIQAKNSHRIDRVFLSTDDDELAAIGEEYGAEIIRRPDWPDADTASGGRPIQHALEVTPEIDTFVFLLPTMPCRYPDDIDRMIEEFEQRGLDGLWPFAFHREPCLHNYHSPGFIHRVWTEYSPEYYDHACGMGVQTREWVFSDQDVFTTGSDKDMWDSNYGTEMTPRAFIEFKPFQTSDCDTQEEIEFCELVLDHYILKGRGPQIYYDYGRVYPGMAGNLKQL